MRKILLRKAPAGVLVADDLSAGVPALVRVMPVGWLQPDTLAYLRSAHEALVQPPQSSLLRTPALEVVHSARVALLTRPYLPGCTLKEWSASETGDLDGLLRISLSAVQALSALHELGIVHGNLKGSNVCLDANTASLVDYGLSLWDPRQATRSMPVRPEHPASDMSSLGATLLESCHQLEPRRRAATGSADEYRLRSTMLTVLQRLADGEYQVLSAAIRDLGEIAEVAQRDTLHAEGPAIGAHDVRRDLASSTFVSRPAEWALLTEAFDVALSDRAQSILMEGPAGIGKTRLLEEFARWAEQERGAQVAYIKSDADVAPRPHLLLIQLVASLRRLREDHRATGSAGQSVIGPASIDLATELPGEVRVREAAQWFAVQLNALRSSPTVIIIDDCQFTRHEDREFVSLLAEEIRSVGRGAVLIFVHRGAQPVALDEAPISAEAVDWLVKVAPLPAQGVQSLVRTMTGQLEDGIVHEVISWASGNPLAAQNAVRFLVDTKAITPSPKGWLGGKSLPTPPAVLHSRVRSLPLEARTILKAAAVIGSQGSLELLALATDISLPTCQAIVADMTSQGLLHVHGPVNDRAYAFSHDTVRETFLASDVDTGLTNAAVHRSVARALIHLGSHDDFDLAFHLASAGQLSEAHSYAIRAGRAARERYSLATARQYFEIALSTQENWALLAALGEVLMLAGDYTEAAETLTRALTLQTELATDVVSQASTLHLLGKTYFKMGALQDAEIHFVRALDLLGESVPSSTSRLLAATLREVGVRLWLSRRHAILPTAEPEDLRVRASIFGSLMYCLWFHDSVKALWAQAREMRLVQMCSEDAPERGHALATQAVLFGCMLGMRGHVVRAGEAALEIRVKAGDVWGKAHAEHLYGVALLGVGEYERALEHLTPAVERFDRTADRWEAHTARWHRALAHYRLGDPDTAAREAEEVRVLARSIGDRQNWILATTVQTMAQDGDASTSASDSEPQWTLPTDVEGRYDVESSVSTLLTRALRALKAREIDDADDALDEALSEMRKAHILNIYVAPIFSWRATVARWKAETSTDGSAQEKRWAMRALGRSCTARLVSRVYATEREHAALEMQQCQELARRVLTPGSPARAVGYFRRRLAGDPLPESSAAMDSSAFTSAASTATSGSEDGDASSLRQGAFATAMQLLRRVAHADGAAVIEVVGDAQGTRTLAGSFPDEAIEWLRAGGRLHPDRDLVCNRFQTSPPRMTQVLVMPLWRRLPWVLLLERVHPAGFSDVEREAAMFVRELLARAMQMEDAAASDAAASIMREEAWRTRLASDLHDEVGQRLSASSMEVRRLENAIHQGRTDSFQDMVTRIGEQLVACNESVRNLVYETAPPSVSQFGLIAAVRDLVERASTSSPTTRFSANITSGGEGSCSPIPPAIEIACFRIIQESVMNVIKHASATECTVILTVGDDALSVIVEDDGKGLRVGSDTHGYGLTSMRERASVAGGALHLAGMPGAGTTVSALLPLAPALVRAQVEPGERSETV